jgi:hypothetical protein
MLKNGMLEVGVSGFVLGLRVTETCDTWRQEDWVRDLVVRRFHATLEFIVFEKVVPDRVQSGRDLAPGIRSGRRRPSR